MNFAKALSLSLNKPLDILLNNAGIMNRERKETADGFEEVFSVNHLAYFTLTLMLIDAMKNAGGGRIVNVASMAYRFVSEMNFDDLQSKANYKGLKVYEDHKILFDLIYADFNEIGYQNFIEHCENQINLKMLARKQYTVDLENTLKNES